jgi:beta-galactosidase/beta-glucuronidase
MFSLYCFLKIRTTQISYIYNLVLQHPLFLLPNLLLMKRLIAIFTFVTLYIASFAQPTTQWKMVEGKIASTWAENINPLQPLSEYPRPQMMRANWINLNGSWNYSLQTKSDQAPATWDGKILVPFAVESALSGVGKRVGKDSLLWYERKFTLPAASRKGKLLLHFGAVDWLCEVFINGKPAGTHKGGYDPFSFDITALIDKKAEQQIVVKVWDPTDDGPQPRGKQVKNPHGIWYTPVTGIWQTVWLETVPVTYISSLNVTPDADRKTITVKTDIHQLQAGDEIKVLAYKGAEKIAESTLAAQEGELTIANPELWSPTNPFLYDLQVLVSRKGKVIDQVKSYFAMRKISMKTDVNGIQRMLLNDEFLFQFGPLDQGWWPDGLYTAPSDEALKFDIVKTREMGFNMIRKHVKVEPARWYYHCDKLGMLVWQDMPSGDLGNRWDSRPGVSGLGSDQKRSAESEEIYRTEWSEIMKDFHHFPSIVVWVPFNEAWGQFKTKEITEWTMKQDPSRLVNSASGGNFEITGHIFDLHNYPEPAMPTPELFGKKEILVLGEYGGLGLPVEQHTWQDKNNWGYQSFKNKEELYNRYAEFINRIPTLIEKGLSAAIYTQTTDVEVETNGLMTYDRKVIKMPEAKLFSIHQQLYNPALYKKFMR